MKNITVQAGVYRDGQGTRRTLFGQVGGKYIQTLGEVQDMPLIRVVSGSGHRFRETMGVTPERAFTPEELRAFLPRLIASRPRRLCNRCDRWLFFTNEGKQQLAAMIDVACAAAEMRAAQAPSGTSSILVQVVGRNPETRKPVLTRVGNLIRQGLTRVKAISSHCRRLMRLTGRRADSDEAASVAQLRSSVDNDG